MQSWDDMRIFLSVARNETLSGAGKTLRMDPATVGRRIARLEEGMGQALFARCANFVLPRVFTTLAKANPDLDLQIVALPRVVNLSRREADMAITVSPPTASRLSYQRITDYHLHLAASDTYLSQYPPLTALSQLKTHRIVGYIPDMIFDKELDYLNDMPVDRVALASNAASVQLQLLRQHGGIGIAHDFALPFAPGVRRVLTDQLSITRSIYLDRHAEDRRLDRISRFAKALVDSVRSEVAQLEARLCNT